MLCKYSTNNFLFKIAIMINMSERTVWILRSASNELNDERFIEKKRQQQKTSLVMLHLL